MNEIGIFKAMFLCCKYKNTNETEKVKTRKKWFQKIVNYAKQNSPYYRELYKNIGDKFEFSDLSPTNKKELMLHFNLQLAIKKSRLY